MAALIAAPSRIASAESSGLPSDSAPACAPDDQGSPFIPVDSWIYPAVMRLHGLGFVDTAYLGMRPWTRASVSHMLKESAPALMEDAKYDATTIDEAQGIFDVLVRELHYSLEGECLIDSGNAHLESAYSTMRALSGTPLRDSYHLGSTLVNDYGRPYQNGANNYSGISGYATAGRFLIYARGEFQGAPSAAGYSTALAQNLSNNVDFINFLNPVTNRPYSQQTIPLGPIGTVTNGRLLEAYVSTQVLNHVISFGKQDEWLGPGQGGAMAYSNNADNIYALHINRVEPLYVPYLSALTGPFRYEFLVGPLQGHTYVPATSTSWVNPGAPWVHVEKVSFKPTRNLEFGFERTVIWGGKGHEPITLHTFLRSFFDANNHSPAVKNSRRDPGARFSAVDITYRLPFLENWLTLYTDSEVHDEVSPVSSPRRAAFRPGLYLSHLPRLPRLDLRAEAVTTDPPASGSVGGTFMYIEAIYRQGYTNKGALFGDWIGREDKGGQGWITYHLSPNEWIQANVRSQKAAKDFIPGGTTLNDLGFQAVKRIGKEFEVNGQFNLEHWKAHVYRSGQQTVTATTIQITWFPRHRLVF